MTWTGPVVLTRPSLVILTVNGTMLPPVRPNAKLVGDWRFELPARTASGTARTTVATASRIDPRTTGTLAG